MDACPGDGPGRPHASAQDFLGACSPLAVELSGERLRAGQGDYFWTHTVASVQSWADISHSSGCTPRASLGAPRRCPVPLGVAPAAAVAACPVSPVWLVLAEVPVSRGNLCSRAGAGSWGLVQGPGDPVWRGPWRAAVSRLGGVSGGRGQRSAQRRAGARAGHLGPLGIVSGVRGHGHCLPGGCKAVPTLPVTSDHPPLELREPL